MTLTLLEKEPPIRREPTAKPQPQLILPTKTKLSPSKTNTGNRYDIVLACQPDARDNYSLYNAIFDFIEEERDFRIYSPHKDVEENRHTVQETTIFTTREAIPRTRGVLVHLSTITPEIQKMFDSTYLNSRPFLLFYSRNTTPFSESTGRIIRSDPSFRGEIRYSDEDNALSIISQKLNNI